MPAMFATLNDMWYEFTAAAQRALVSASGWSNGSECDELQPQPLLVGLLSQPECRAAVMLAKVAIDIVAVRRRWPELVETAAQSGAAPLLAHAKAAFSTLPYDAMRTQRFSKDVELSLELARQRLALLPQPLELATEHMLLGLATADHEVSLWLREKGLDPEQLEAEICRLYGCPPVGTWGETRDELQGPGDSGRASGTPAPVVTLRILDAAGNRAREGLRVVEDYVRFGLDDRHLTELLKQLRHDLTDAVGRLPGKHLLAARETQADVGTELTTASERQRADTADVLAANLSRVEESLRSLEEFGKTADPGLAAAFKDMRYRTYTLERAVAITRSSIERLAGATLYVLVDGRRSVDEFEQFAASLIAAGVDVLQLRDKGLTDRELVERARLLRSVTRAGDCPNFRVSENETVPFRSLFIVNDRPDIAELSSADGVHLGQEDMSVKDARSIVGPEMLVGVSTHNIEQARQAVLDGANYIGVGPTFPSGTKQFQQFPGVELLCQVAAEIRLPAFAIGGISRANVAEVLATGIMRIAVSGAILADAAPGQVVKELKGLLGNQ